MFKLSPQIWATVGLALVLGFCIGGVLGNNYGKATINNKWSEAKVNQANQATIQSENIREVEREHASKSTEVADNAQISKTQYDADIAAAQSGADDRVRQSEARANKYLAMSKASAIEQDHLAKYAARLDASLTEGRQLVTELRATLAERERTIHNLSQQIDADRKLMNEHY